MANSRIGGVVEFKIDGEIYRAKGSWEYSIGVPKKEMVVGADSVHGFKEMPTVPYLQGTITDGDDLDLEFLRSLRDVTVTLGLANGKMIVIEQAVEASDGAGTSEEGELEVRFEGITGREISA